MSALLLDGALLHYEAWGRGKPLVLLHGWLGSWRYWMPTMEALSSDYRAYCFDFWGFGDSAKVKPRYNIVSYVRLLDDFLVEMGIQSTALVGHSVGGIVAMILASRRPERVERLVLVDTPIQPGAIHGRLRSFSNPLASQLLWRQEAHAAIRRLLGGFRISYEEVDSEAAKTDPDAITETMRSLAAISLENELRRVQMPVLAVFGSSDPVVNSSQAATIENLCQHARAIVLDQSRHFPMLEEPAKFHRLLRDFLVEQENPESLQVKEMWHRRTH